MARLTDDFIAQIADEYREHSVTGKPSTLIAEQRGVPIGTVHRWIIQARRRGLLPPGTPGKVTTTPLSEQDVTAAQLVGAHFRRLRKEARLSQQEAGDAMGQETGLPSWSRQAVSAAEKGRRAWAADDIVAMARLFGVAPGSVFEALPACSRCKGDPPDGFTCNVCGTTKES